MRNCSEMKYSVVFVIVLHLRFHEIFCNIPSMRKEIWPLNLLFNHGNHTFFGFYMKLFWVFLKSKFFLLSRENKDTWYIESRTPFQKLCYGFSLKHYRPETLTYFVLGLSIHQRIGCGKRIQAHFRTNWKDYWKN